jgi:GDPmannose 4,6-dehydratase
VKKALITGVTGQDGSYLSEYLLEQGYEVHGLIRRSSTLERWRIDHISGKFPNQFVLHYGDMHDDSSLSSIVKQASPDEIYNLAAQSHVRISFDTPVGTSEVVALGTLKLLEVVRVQAPEARFYQASSSEMFGSAAPPQMERTIFEPRSPYAVSKVFSHWVTQNYREGYNLFAVNGILFNHESPRRGDNFVTRKIANAAVAIANGKLENFYLGNTAAIRDWGYAPEYVQAMHAMLQLDKPMDFVIGTGLGVSVQEYLEWTFGYCGLNWENHVLIDPNLFRPTEVDALVADASKAKEELNWSAKTFGEELAKLLVDAEEKRFSRGLQMVDPWVRA